MMKNLKRILSLVLSLTIVVGLLPVTALAAVDSSGKPTDLKNKLVLSIYTTEGSFPGEPAMHGSSEYISFNSSFQQTSASGQFKSSAESELKPSILNDMVQGTSSGNNTVWGVFSTEGLKEKYFLPNASIIQPENEADIIRAIKTDVANKSDEEVLKKYEIIWYVIKLQHSPSWLSWLSTTEWHIDGLIKEKTQTKTVTINYYGNGNTTGSAPDGVTNHVAGEPYTILDSNMTKKIHGVEVAFLGWSAKADGTGEEEGFYQPGDVIKPTKSISLYAMWDTTTQYTATVNTYLDGTLTDDSDIHGTTRDLYLSTDKEHYYQLTRNGEGVYSVKITGNGKFQLFNKASDGNYTQIGNHQLTIYNQNASLDVHHYSVTYNANGGAFAADPGKQIYYYGEAVTAIAETPAKEGYRFVGWEDGKGNLIQPGTAVTASITAPVTLTAKWEKTVNVTINVTINHEGGDGYDQVVTKDDVFLGLVSRENDSSPYLETGDTLTLNDSSYEGFEFKQEGNITTYTGYTYTDMPGGAVDYTVVTSKSGYDTKITPTQDADGNWTIDVVMTYNPTNFDVEFTVEVDSSVPEQYIPIAAIVKVTFWSVKNNRWEIITQQEGGAPGVRVDINPNTRRGSGSYPVWKYESNGTTPYGYRIEVTSFVYPDGAIVRASQVVTQDVAWSDNVYTATVDDVTGGKAFGTLDGAYIGDNGQQGTLNAVITMDLYNVTFDAQGGTVNGQASQTVTEQYKIPGFNGYVPSRKGGYTFGGWYVDQSCTEKATEGMDLSAENTVDGNITLYAKWIDPLTIEGSIEIFGKYWLNGVEVSVNDVDKATEAVVVLQEYRNGSYVEVDTQEVTFVYGNDENGSASYSFTEIPNEGKEYRIQLLLLNYTTKYDNEGDADKEYQETEYTAEFAGDNVAKVDAKLTFVPPSYDQEMIVETNNISEKFIPKNVLAKITYRDTGDNHPFQVISQHRDDENFGVNIALINGTGSGKESIWKWHTDGTLYEYQMYITKVDGTDYDSDTAPYYIIYDEPAYWNSNTNTYSGPLKAVLSPKTYPVIFDLNAGTDTVTGMDAFKIEGTDTDEEGNVSTTYAYETAHTWSHDTAITAVPQREGYRFLGWTADVENAYVDGKISADVHQEVTLTAQWEKITYQVTAKAEPGEGGAVTGAGTYDYGTEVAVTATPNPGYRFLGWYENGELVSNDSAYSFEIYNNHAFIAKFSLNQHTVKTEAEPSAGGTTSGDGEYNYGTEVTITATANTGYKFTGWYNGDKKISDEQSFQVTVTENLSFTAKFERIQYSVITEADPTEGGATSGDGTYFHGAQVTVKADAETGYVFAGWFEEGVKVSEDANYSFEATGNRKLVAKFVKSYKVTATYTDGGTTTGSGYYDAGETATVTAIAQKDYQFIGWFNEEGEMESDSAEYSFVVTSDRTIKAKFIRAYTITTIASPAGAGDLTGGGTYGADTSVTITATVNDGYYFVGWYDETGTQVTAEKSFTITVRNDRTFTAKFEKKVSYDCDFVYIFGYTDTEIGAEGPLLRGELAQMIYRLVKQKTGVSSGNNSFSDTEGQWFRTGISYMAAVGAIDKTKSRANPYVQVTRGETYKMICLGLGFTKDTTLNFSDYERILRNSGHLTSEAKLTGKITRWEFCELFNAILGRSRYCPDGFYDVNGNEVTAETYGYTDLKPTDPYYRTMMIATSTFTNDRIDLAKREQRNPLDEYNG